MRKFRQLGLSLVLAVALLGAMAVPALATNPTVSIKVTAQVISITNSEANWQIGVVETSATVYFSATGEADHDYSMITNTGSVAVDVEIQGTNFVPVDPTYTWTLAADGTPGDQIYGLKANWAEGATYNITVKSSGYNDLTTNLAKTLTHDWSMEFKGPTAFNAADDGLEKSATVTLVASKHIP